RRRARTVTDAYVVDIHSTSKARTHSTYERSPPVVSRVKWSTTNHSASAAADHSRSAAGRAIRSASVSIGEVVGGDEGDTMAAVVVVIASVGAASVVGGGATGAPPRCRPTETPRAPRTITAATT